MDRPDKGRADPNHQEPAGARATKGRGSTERDDSWSDALQALRAVGRHREPDEASRQPDRPVPTRASTQHPGPIDDTLEALQALARRYPSPTSEPDADESAPRSSEKSRPNEPESPPEPDYAAYEPPPLDEFDEPTPGARLLSRRARFASIALILISAAVLAVLLLGALSLTRQLFHANDIPAERAPPAAPEVSSAPSTPSPPPSTPAASEGTNMVAVASPSATGAADLRAIENAMADCDEEAAKNPDALYFVVVPAVSPIKDYSQWAPLSVGDVGTSISLLRSKDALDGLRNRTLSIYSGQYRFSIIDASTDASHDWGPVAGVAKFIKLDAAAIAGFRVRFGFADFVGSTPSNFRFPRDKGTCYWVSALLRN